MTHDIVQGIPVFRLEHYSLNIIIFFFCIIALNR